MNRTKIIYDLIITYENTDNQMQMENVQEAAFTRGKNIFNDCSEYLGKSRNTLVDIYYHGKHLILNDLCRLAEYLDCNVYTFFHKFSVISKEEFLRVDTINKADEEKAVAAELYMQLENLRKNYTKEFFVWNIKNYVKEENDDLDDHKTWLRLAPPAWKLLMGICDAEREAVRVWMTVKKPKRIPVKELCEIATVLDMDVIDLLTKRIGE